MICIPVIPALRRLRLEDHKIEATWDPVKEGNKKRKRGMEKEREGGKETKESRREKWTYHPIV